jgi:two-component system chemotaxis sensor kinase CheA
VERKDYASLLALVERRGGYDEIVRTLRGWELDPAQARLERLAEYGQALASRLGKPAPEVVCDGGGVRVNNALWAPLWAACVHLVRNAVDHGLETPTEREALAKDARGKLTLSAKAEDQSLVLKFSDDGRGVQWDKVARKAASLGLPFQTEAERTEALFRDGFSSLDLETDVSGRGIGMAAVREQVSRFGGAINLITEQGHGTTIELRFPANRMAPSPRSQL